MEQVTQFVVENALGLSLALYFSLGFTISFIELYYWDIKICDSTGPEEGILLIPFCTIVWPIVILANLGRYLGLKLRGEK